MRLRLLILSLMLGAAGCASEAPGPTATAGAAPASAALPPPTPFRHLQTVQGARHANRLDRGQLLGYDRSRKPQVRGAETFHAVELSEAHARAMAAPGRDLRLETPSGEQLKIAFERSEPGYDSNWTWAGKTEEGLTALITFGEKAVFGRIERRGKPPLLLLTERGRTWMVQTDPAKQPQMEFEGTDALIPTAEMVAAVQRKQAAASHSSPPSASSKEFSAAAQTPFNTVDIAMGYTPGLAAQLGGDSQARSRIAFLIALTNQSLAAGLIQPRVRLVHTMSVNYSDAPTVTQTLYTMNGFDCSSGTCVQVPIPPALQALRNARDQYGADLFALMRPYRLSHEYCGLAWTLGSNGAGFTSDYAYWANAVISDGVRPDGWRCDDTTTAHEFGHNFGQGHNIEDSGNTTFFHPYAYGYREASASGFATVMAYPLTSGSQQQFVIAVFGNPAATYDGRPAGSANADNARSMNQTMPLVAAFRNAVVPMPQAAANDFNGDNRSDILWRYLPQDYLATWFMNGTTISDFWYTLNGAPASYTIMGSGDFDGDGLTDLLWKGPTGDLWLWVRTPVSFVGGFVGQEPADWNLVGIGDVTADGKSDLIWRHGPTGQVAYWQMNRETIVTGGAVTPNAAGYRFVAAKDLNGDFRTELIWSNDTLRQLHVWTPVTLPTRTIDFSTTMIGTYATDRTPVGAGDITGDGRADIHFRFPGSGAFGFWAMNGTAIIGQTTVGSNAPAAYRYISAGDYNGDTYGDVLWDNGGIDIRMWFSNGNGFSEQKVADTPAGWLPVL